MPVAGYLWVEGTAVHYTDASGNERADTGTTTGATGTAGFFWIEGDSLHYIDASGDERYLPFEHIGTAPTVSGYIWIEGNLIHYSAQTDADEKVWHTDTPHSDIHNDVYSDSHTNGYSDTHTDIPYYDTHANISHLNEGHIDEHTDIPSWYDSGMTWARAHEDVPYDDSHYNGHVNTGYIDYHTDTGHNDSHLNEGTDVYSDYTHTDGYHYDSTVPHIVAVNYTDTSMYTDVAAVDRPPIV